MSAGLLWLLYARQYDRSLCCIQEGYSEFVIVYSWFVLCPAWKRTRIKFKKIDFNYDRTDACSQGYELPYYFEMEITNFCLCLIHMFSRKCVPFPFSLSFFFWTEKIEMKNIFRVACCSLLWLFANTRRFYLLFFSIFRRLSGILDGAVKLIFHLKNVVIFSPKSSKMAEIEADERNSSQYFFLLNEFTLPTGIEIEKKHRNWPPLQFASFISRNFLNESRNCCSN